MKPYPHLATSSSHPGSRTSLRDQCFFLPLYTYLLWSCCQLVQLWCHCGQCVIPETVLTSLLLCHHRQSVLRFAHAPFTVLLSCSRVCPVLHLSSPIRTTLSTLHECNIITWHGTSTVTVGAEKRPLVEGAQRSLRRRTLNIEDEEFTAVDVETANIRTQQAEQRPTTGGHWYQAERV